MQRVPRPPDRQWYPAPLTLAPPPKSDLNVLNTGPSESWTPPETYRQLSKAVPACSILLPGNGEVFEIMQCKEFGNIEQVHTAGEREMRFEEVDARLHHRDQLNMIGCTQHILDIEAD
ncbi:hypothetical protein MAR_027212 [Mya arenaria]|uniref:Uncharacterized protein n=1 Tax=Mya arenaria TaxID=6604 RepID=A0ABY7EVU5_MYAAR|nr:hypothetical protein MAR_027212 [Mya arenaria]